MVSSSMETAPRRSDQTDLLQCRCIFHRPARRRVKRQHCLHFRPGVSCLGSLQPKCVIIIPPLFITTMHRVLTALQFHLRWNSWLHHKVEIDLAWRDFPSPLMPTLIFYFWWQRECDVSVFFALVFTFGVVRGDFSGPRGAQAAAP